MAPDVAKATTAGIPQSNFPARPHFFRFPAAPEWEHIPRRLHDARLDSGNVRTENLKSTQHDMHGFIQHVAQIRRFDLTLCR